MNIYSMSEMAAKRSVINILKECGFDNIKIGSVFYKGMVGDHMFEVNYSAEKNNDVVDLNKQMTKRN